MEPLPPLRARARPGARGVGESGEGRSEAFGREAATVAHSAADEPREAVGSAKTAGANVDDLIPSGAGGEPLPEISPPSFEAGDHLDLEAGSWSAVDMGPLDRDGSDLRATASPDAGSSPAVEAVEPPPTSSPDETQQLPFAYADPGEAHATLHREETSGSAISASVGGQARNELADALSRSEGSADSPGYDLRSLYEGADEQSHVDEEGALSAVSDRDTLAYPAQGREIRADLDEWPEESAAFGLGEPTPEDEVLLASSAGEAPTAPAPPAATTGDTPPGGIPRTASVPFTASLPEAVIATLSTADEARVRAIAERLERIARTLRERGSAAPLAEQPTDPLGALITGYLLGFSEANDAEEPPQQFRKPRGGE
jgi:hypothetical protein